MLRHTPIPENLSPNNSKFFGVRSLLDLSVEMSQSRCSSWSGLESPRTITTYHSKERDLIHKLCGWDTMVRRRTGKKSLAEICRSAAIAVFNLDIEAAVDILSTGCSASTAKVN